jgi:hypothetical protein
MNQESQALYLERNIQIQKLSTRQIELLLEPCFTPGLLGGNSKNVRPPCLVLWNLAIPTFSFFSFIIRYENPPSLYLYYRSTLEWISAPHFFLALVWSVRYPFRHPHLKYVAMNLRHPCEKDTCRSTIPTHRCCLIVQSVHTISGWLEINKGSTLCTFLRDFTQVRRPKAPARIA